MPLKGSRSLVSGPYRSLVQVGPSSAAALGTRPPRWVLACTAAIPLLMTGSWLLAGELQPRGYSPVRQSVSVLAGHAARYRWIVTATLLVVAGCYLLTAAGLTPLATRARLGLVVVGLTAAGIAASPEPTHGSTPQHLTFTALGAVVIALWPLLMLQTGEPLVPLLRNRTCVLASALFVALSLWAFVETRTDDTLGLAERLSSTTAICWPFIVCCALWAQGRSTRPRSLRP
jgi:hypothetical protein